MRNKVLQLFGYRVEFSWMTLPSYYLADFDGDVCRSVEYLKGIFCDHLVKGGLPLFGYCVIGNIVVFRLSFQFHLTEDIACHRDIFSSLFGFPEKPRDSSWLQEGF